MKKLLFLLLVLLWLTVPGFSQNGAPQALEVYLHQNNLQTKTAEDGLHYIIEKPGGGAVPKQGDYVLVRYKGMLLDSTVFDQSEEKEPFVFQVGNREVIKGLDKGVRLLKPGGRATFFIPPSLGYMGYGVGDAVPPNSPLIYQLELVGIMNFKEYDAYMRRLEERERHEFERQREEQFQKDISLLEDYIVAHQLQVRRTGSGLRYVITKPGKGENARPGNKLRVVYEGFLLDGTPIEKGAGEKPFEFYLGAGKVMDGWEEGLQFFNKGSEGWLLVPSRLAYGPLTIEEKGIFVPGNSVLVFKIKVEEILR